MGWNKDGSTITAEYLDSIITGIVTESRVKYGGKVQYTVKLAEPIFLRWRGTEPVSTLLVDEDNVLTDFGVILQ